MPGHWFKIMVRSDTRYTKYIVYTSTITSALAVQNRHPLPGHGHCAQILVWGHGKRVCSHKWSENRIGVPWWRGTGALGIWLSPRLSNSSSPSLDLTYTGSLHCRLLFWLCLDFQGHWPRWKQNKELSPGRQAVLVYKKWYALIILSCILQPVAQSCYPYAWNQQFLNGLLLR